MPCRRSCAECNGQCGAQGEGTVGGKSTGNANGERPLALVPVPVPGAGPGTEVGAFGPGQDFDQALNLSEDHDTGALWLIGYDRTTGEKENYGGSDGSKIPPQAIVAYMMVNDEAWQTVPTRKGKRGRS